MLKIVEIHAAESVRGEYVVLQNLGPITVSLRGWAYLEGDTGALAEQMFVFREEVLVKPYIRVVLFTGCGEDGWVPTIDGMQAYCAYWNRTERIWNDAANVHVLHISATRRICSPDPAQAIPA
jgi:hypothetical protein